MIKRIRTDTPGVSVRKLLIIAVGMVLVAGCSVLPGSGDPEPGGRVVIATGGTRGVYYGYGTTLASELHRDLDAVTATVLPTTGSVENLLMVGDGRATFAFSAGDFDLSDTAWRLRRTSWLIVGM